MTSNLVPHHADSTRRAHEASWEEVDAVPLPFATRSFVPVPHRVLRDHVARELEAAGFRIQCERLALASSGRRFFATLDLIEGERCDLVGQGVGFAVGLRNSYDTSLAAGVASGARVFVCDNLAFSGEVVAFPTFDREDLPGVVADGIRALPAQLDAQRRTLKELRSRLMPMPLVDIVPRFLISAAEDDLVSWSALREVLAGWRLTREELAAQISINGVEPEFRATRWHLLNAFTATMRNDPPFQVEARTRQLVARLVNLN